MFLGLLNVEAMVETVVQTEMSTMGQVSASQWCCPYFFLVRHSLSLKKEKFIENKTLTVEPHHLLKSPPPIYAYL